MSHLNEHGITHLRHVDLAVTDYETQRAFYRDTWGLTEQGTDSGLSYFAAEGSPEQYVVRLRQSDEKRLDLIAFGSESRESVDSLAEHLGQTGVQLVAEPDTLQTAGGGYGFRFFSPDGLPFEISSDVARGETRDLARWEGVPVKISHIVLHSPDHQAMVKWFCEVLGFRVSDWLGDFMGFLRCNSAHHRLAILPGPPCLNHVAYDVLTIDDMMKGIARLKKNDVDIKWGPGRHTAGNNTFSYFTTPAMNVVEYTSELEEVDDDHHQQRVAVGSANVVAAERRQRLVAGDSRHCHHSTPDRSIT